MFTTQPPHMEIQALNKFANYEAAQIRMAKSSTNSERKALNKVLSPKNCK